VAWGPNQPAVSRIRLIVRLTGRVQGVGFRDTVIFIAGEYDVAGSVRNLRGGDALEIDVEGSQSEVSRFVEAVLARPPSFARIESVSRTPAEPRGAVGFGRGSTF